MCYFSGIPITWQRSVAFLHRWLGIVLGALFAAWFASGIVLMYARMPRLAPAERLARLAALDLSRAAISPREAADRYRLDDVHRVRVGMLAGRPIYRFWSRTGQAGGATVFADTGERLERLTAAQAIDEARRFAPECSAAARYDGSIDRPDQWTLELRALLPLHRVALGGCDESVVYVSERGGDVVLRTTASARRAAYAGAVIHWLYFTPLRRHGALWSQIVIYSAAAGTLTCLLGLVWGFYLGLRTPYRGWMRWHHYAGLAFGVVSLTWVFSGLLSMEPWGWRAETAPTDSQQRAFDGGSLALASVTLEELRVGWSARASAERRPKEIEIVPFRGEARLLVDGEPERTIDRGALLVAAVDAMPAASIADIQTLDAYDAYYYDRAGELALPVLRVRYGDDRATWLYVDPKRGAIVRRADRLSRINRWAYHGLHSLDFPPLYRRRPLWDVVVIILSLGGLASAVTAAVPAWRRLRRLV